MAPDSKFNRLNVAQIFFVFFIFAIFFPIRYVFATKSAYLIGVYSDFTSISLYLSDIFLFVTWCFCFLPRGMSNFWSEIKDKGLWIFIIWLILGIIWHYQANNSVIWWYSLKYAELIVAYGTTKYLYQKTSINPGTFQSSNYSNLPIREAGKPSDKLGTTEEGAWVKHNFLSIFAAFSTLEAIIALWQFRTQKSVGLLKLGEPLISKYLTGTANIVSGGTRFIRAYGTFPHPNILSAFMVTGVLVILYFLVNAKTAAQKALLSLILLINTLGLTVSFSRAGYLALICGLAIFFGYLIFHRHSNNNEPRQDIKGAMVIMAGCIILALVMFRPFLLTRATISDGASLQRIFYAKIGLKMIASQPIFGLGIGESLLHMQQFSPVFLRYWEIQPIHNYFLLAAAELGILGMLILLWVFLQHLWSLIKKLKLKTNPQLTTYNLLLTTILCVFLVLMQFDHYFYTLQQTQMLLWIILGIIGAEINPQPGDSSRT